MLGGEQFQMSKWLDLTFGDGTAERVQIESYKKVKLSTADIQAIADKYKSLCD